MRNLELPLVIKNINPADVEIQAKQQSQVRLSVTQHTQHEAIPG